jgi:hypothetical protein
MRYFVLTQTGRYGPADIAQLSQWAGEGRISPETMLEDETGVHVKAGSVAGLMFSTFQDVPAAGNVVPAAPKTSSSAGSQPIPPSIVSNYRRPDYEPPLFLEHEVDGRRELLYSFLLAIAAPFISLIHIYGIAMAFGGVYCAIVAIRRGRALGFLSLALSILAVPAAFLLQFGIRTLF